jgi:hypothetical protein
MAPTIRFAIPPGNHKPLCAAANECFCNSLEISIHGLEASRSGGLQTAVWNGGRFGKRPSLMRILSAIGVPFSTSSPHKKSRPHFRVFKILRMLGTRCAALSGAHDDFRAATSSDEDPRHR